MNLFATLSPSLRQVMKLVRFVSPLACFASWKRRKVFTCYLISVMLRWNEYLLSTTIAFLSTWYFSYAAWRMHPDPCYVTLIRWLLLLSLRRTIKSAVNCYLLSDADKNTTDHREAYCVTNTLEGFYLHIDVATFEQRGEEPTSR